MPRPLPHFTPLSRKNRDLHRPPPRRRPPWPTTRALHESPRTPPRGTSASTCPGRAPGPGSRGRGCRGKARDRRIDNYTTVIAPIVGTTLDDVGLRAVRVLAARRAAARRVHCTLPCGCTSPISAHNQEPHRCRPLLPRIHTAGKPPITAPSRRAPLSALSKSYPASARSQVGTIVCLPKTLRHVRVSHRVRW